MPQQFHNIEVDNLWKIKRKVAKIMRANNDDDRGLTETKDMSESTEKLTSQLGQLSNLLYDVTLHLRLRGKTEKALSSIQGPNILEKIDSITKIVTKTDFNKMDVGSIQSVKEAITKITAQKDEANGILSAEEDLANEEMKEADDALEPDSDDEVDVQEYKKYYDAYLEAVQDHNISVDTARYRQKRAFQYTELYDKIDILLDLINIKMSFYKETSAVIEGGRMIGGRMIGGCNCNSTSLKYRPEYQTPEYY